MILIFKKIAILKLIILGILLYIIYNIFVIQFIQIYFYFFSLLKHTITQKIKKITLNKTSPKIITQIVYIPA